MKPVKLTVLGLQGSGKTYLVKHTILDAEPNHLVIDPSDEYTGYTRYVPRFQTDYDSLSGELRMVAKKMVFPHLITLEQLEKGKKDKPDRLKLLVLDEADLYMPSKRAMNAALHDLYVKQRHYRLGIVAITRRPTDLSTYVMDTSDYLIIFKIVGYNALKVARAINPDLVPSDKKVKSDEKAIKNLDYSKYEFLFLDRERNIKKFTLDTFDAGLIGLSGVHVEGWRPPEKKVQAEDEREALAARPSGFSTAETQIPESSPSKRVNPARKKRRSGKAIR